MSEKSLVPKHLSKESKVLWKKLCDEYALDDVAGRLLLETALSARDRAEEARRRIAREGAVILDRFGQKRSHPSIAIERDSKATMVRALKALNLDLEPLRDGPGGPPGR